MQNTIPASVRHQIHQTRHYRKSIKIGRATRTLVVKVCWGSGGNKHNSLSITGALYRGTVECDRNWISGGCIHDTIAKFFPEFKPYLKWHLWGPDAGLHTVANTIYFATADGVLGGERTPYITNRVLAIDGTSLMVSLPDDLVDYLVDKLCKAEYEGLATVKGEYHISLKDIDKLLDNKVVTRDDVGELVDVTDYNNLGGGTTIYLKYRFSKTVGYKFSTVATYKYKNTDGMVFGAVTAHEIDGFLKYAQEHNCVARVKRVTKSLEVGKTADIKAARDCCVWPDATLEQLRDKDAINAHIAEILPELYHVVTDVFGFEW